MKWPWCWKCWHRRNEHEPNPRGCRHVYWAGRNIGLMGCMCTRPGTYGLAWEAERAREVSR